MKYAASIINFFSSPGLTCVCNAQSDVTPKLIMSRVESASGAKYSFQKEQPRKFEPIAPVGSSYSPIGKVDIAAMRRDAAPKPANVPSPASVPAPKPGIPSAPRPTPAAAASSKPFTVGGAARAPAGAWDDEPPLPRRPHRCRLLRDRLSSRLQGHRHSLRQWYALLRLHRRPLLRPPNPPKKIALDLSYVYVYLSYRYLHRVRLLRLRSTGYSVHTRVPPCTQEIEESICRNGADAAAAASIACARCDW